MSSPIATHDQSLEGLDGLAGVDALCLFIGEDERPLDGAAGFADWRLCGGLSRLLLQGFFSGARGEQLLLPSSGRIPTPRIFVVGLGRVASLKAAELAEVLKNAATMLKKAGVASVAIGLPVLPELNDEARADAFRSHFLPGFGSAGVSVLAERNLRSLLGGR